MEYRTRDAELALTIPPPGRHENKRLKYLIEKGYLSLNSITFDFDEIPTSKFAEARRKVAKSVVLSPLHADLKAIATWYLERKGCVQISYEQEYPDSARVADVASVLSDSYAEVGQVQDISRIYQMQGIDVVMRGSFVSSVLQRYPQFPRDRFPGPGVREILSVPFPVEGDYDRAWELDEIAIHIFQLGDKRPTTPNRRHPWWSGR
jgi:hypothetical protein